MKVFGAAGTREIDALAASELGLAGETLMERAGRAAFDHIVRRWPEASRILVLAGAGNNAGDGYVVGRLAREAGLEVGLVQLLAPASDGAAGHNYAQLAPLGIRVVDAAGIAAALTPDTVVVDAVFGTGLTRPIEGRIADVFDVVNAADVPRVALDVPSGVAADTGALLGTAFDADLTVTFIAPKLGLVTGAGLATAGELVLDDLGVSARLVDRVVPLAVAGRFDDLVGLLKPRRRDAHKGVFGHVLVVGGYEGMPGAALLAGEAAVRAGAGLVSVATWPSHAGAFVARCPTLMVRPTATADDLAPLAARANVVALGPGLGRAPWSAHVFEAAVALPVPLVVDADALTLLAERGGRRDDWVLTPHPGEAARLLGVETAQIGADRLGAARAIVERYGGVCVLKGGGSVVADAGSGPAFVCTGGNPGMGSGGMGDVLTGVIAGLLAQHDLGLDPAAAARLGVAVHAEAGDRAARAGERGLAAHDLLGELVGVVNP